MAALLAVAILQSDIYPMPDPIDPTADELEQLMTILASISRKAAARVERDPSAVDLLDLSVKAEALAAQLMKRKAS
jgi:hypothetical protein